MSTAIQCPLIMRHGASCRAFAIGLLLAAALSLLPLLNGSAYPPAPVAFFDSSETEAVSFIDGGTDVPSLAPAFAPAVQASADEEAAPLFGMDTEPLLGGNVLVKWSRARLEIARELDAANQCRANGDCPAAAQRLIDLSQQGMGRTGRARVGLINRAVDLAIGPVSDEAQWGVPDHWSAPFETLRTGRGDCEDYAIVKYAALVEAGISKDDVKIVILKKTFPNEDHAVVAVHVDSQWLILDNRTLTLVRDMDLTRAVPELVLDQEGVKRFVRTGHSHGTTKAT
jgi:predicted transglutaminase-like cysteine proteinase